jgi:starvation-inducible DNA-binding protein
MKNLVGLDTTKAKALSTKLNQLLADYQVFYQNLRGLHWNIKGREFFELHLKFEELYNDAVLKIDEIAERILTLEGEPFHTFSDYLAKNTLVIGKNIIKDEEAIALILSSLII